jgi:membrane peptidoglycan carboxypeptidase
MKIIKIALILLLTAACAVAAIFLYPVKTDRYSIDKDLVKQISASLPNYTHLDSIPADLKNALIAVEDKRFYSHFGVDFIGIGRALFTNIKEGEIREGGSTISQQLVKNLFLEPEKSFSRKFKEMILTFRLERSYTKDEILEMYLNVVYFGAGAYGVQDASRTYIGKDVEVLSLGECAMLAGLPQAPTAYNPQKHFDKAKKRQAEVLSAMAELGYDADVLQRTGKEEIDILGGSPGTD